MNGSLSVGAEGQADIFLGGVETKEDILKRILDLGKSIQNSIDRIIKSMEDLKRGVV
jgi:hypothetical protein